VKLYLLTACNYSPGIDRWLETLPRLGGNVIPVIVMYKPHFQVPIHCITLKEDQEFPKNPLGTRFHDVKFEPAKPFVREHKDVFFFVTDTLDVIYQRPLPEVPEGVFACLSGEEVIYAEAPFWRPVIKGPFECLRGEEIYNPGLFAMRGAELLEYWDLVKQLSGSVDQVVDTLALNKYCLENDDKYVIWHDHFCNLYDQLKDTDIRGNLFCRRSTQRPYAAVHGNGSTKYILDLLCQK
jgi:hypothetical protein